MRGNIFGYIKKNFLYIVPFTLLCGILLSATFDYSAFQLLTEKIVTGKIGEISFSLFFRALSVLNVSTWYFFLLSLAVVFLVGVILSLLLAFVEKHMRIGKRTVNGLWNKINDNFLSTFIQILIYLAIAELWALIASSVLFAIDNIFSAVPALEYIFVILFFFGALYVLVYLVQIFYLWLPCAQITGFTFFESLKYSYQLVAQVRKKLLLSFFLHVGVFGLVLFGFSVLNYFFSIPFVFYLVLAAGCVYLFTVFVIGQEVIYFETDQLDRADLSRFY